MAQETSGSLRAGQVFNDRYEIVRCIKAGGMGAVYEVFHKQTRKKRALKVMLPSVVAHEAMRSRFKIEATVVAAVESDHIAEVVDAGVDDATGSPFIVMELLKGEELGSMVARVGKLPPEEVVLFLTQASYGLERTHAEGIVHRDLKPENLYVTYRDDGSPRIKLLDFGIAKVLGDTKTQHTRGILGTPMFISPEQVHGEQAISARTDVYALAHIAYNLLTGEPYWKPEEDEAETLMPFLVRVMKGHSEPASTRAKKRRGVDIPPAFDAWFDKAAAADPDDRFASPLAMAEELAAVFGVTEATPTARTSALPPTSDEAPKAAVAATLQTPIETGELMPAGATVQANPNELRAAQSASVGDSSANAAISRTFSEAPRKSNAGLLVVGAVVLVGAGVFAATRLSAETTPQPSSNLPAATHKPEASAPPTEPAAAPDPEPAADPEPAPSAEPDGEPSAAPSTKAPTLPISRPPHGQPPKPAPSAAPAKPADTGWKPPVIDR